MNTEYKGFTILETGTTGKFVISPDATSFNLDGYATLSNAKGAITKHLKAIGIDPTGDFTGTEARIAETLPASDLSHLYGPSVEAIRDTARLEALITFFGGRKMLRKDKRSRNKREGRYAGKSQKVIITRNGKKVDVMLPVHVRATDICLAHAKRDL